MAVEFNCAQCTQRLRVSDPISGQQARCPQCGHVQHVPQLDAAAPVATPTQSANPYREDVGIESSLGRTLALEPTNPYAAAGESASGGLGFALQPYLASRSLRLAGFFISGIIYFASVVPGLALAGFANANNNNDLSSVAAAVAVAGLVLVGLVNAVLISNSGQSIAKRLLGIRIVQENGQLPGFLRGVVLRHYMLSLTCLCYPIGAIVYFVDGLFIFGGRRQCLHDLVAGTVVVNAQITHADEMN